MDVKAFKAGEIDLTLEIEARYVVQRPSPTCPNSPMLISPHTQLGLCAL